MIDCIETEIRDALPDLIHGRLSKLDRATLGAHVEGCASCRAEVELLKEVRASSPLAPRIDVNAIVAALPKPMPSSAELLISQRPQTQPLSRMRPVFKWVVAAALLIAGTLTFANVRRESVVQSLAVASGVSTPAAATGKAPEAVSVASTSAVPAVIEAPSKVSPAPRVALSLATGVQDLTDDQLQTLLNDLDNVQGLPNVEPEAVSMPIDDEGIQ